jgi:hypothetical protein
MFGGVLKSVCVFLFIKNLKLWGLHDSHTPGCLLLGDKAKANEKTYICVSV